MILLSGPSTKRARWEVVCDVHGHVSWQTAWRFCDLAVRAHKDALDCDEPVYTVARMAPPRWQAHKGDGRGAAGFAVERSSKAAAIAAAARHEKDHQ